MPRILLLLPTTTYRAPDFLAAAARMKVDVVAASEAPSAMASRHPESLVTLDLRDPEASARAALEYHKKYPIDAVVPVDDNTAIVAAAIGSALGLRHNSVESARAARYKNVLAELLARNGVLSPRHAVVPLSDDPSGLAKKVRYPSVLKPLALSGSRGVIRANDPPGFIAAWKRIAAILATREVKAQSGKAGGEILIQEFIAGREFALEGLLSNGELHLLALFDKPDPLDGPYFEETIYVTPSRLPDGDRNAIANCVSMGARALGLREGPVHAEVRLNAHGPWLIELAARSIGGLCSRTLRFGTGLSLEELILRQALGMPIEDLPREQSAAGVMMIPIPRSGILKEIRGLDEARKVEGIVEATITARCGRPVVALPEGSSYLGFLFSRAAAPADAEAALREAHCHLKITID
jgi:biotin carboxylase